MTPSPTRSSNIRHSILLRQLLGRANPIFFLDGAETHDQFVEVLRTLCPRGESLVYANEATVRNIHGRTCARWGIDPCQYPLTVWLPKIELPHHVFPVHEADLDCGLVIPLTIEPAAQWHISDAFGTFGLTSTDPLIGLFQMLARVEAAWEERYGEVLPTRWLRALSLRLPCPVHMALFEGRSLQLPLLLAVLRGLSAAANPDGVVPFGIGPMFATGTVEADGSFGPVANVGDKLAGFIRELGPGHPALLTTVQQRELQGSFPDLLNQVEVTNANNLAELLDGESLRQGLQQLCTAYEPAWNEELLSLANSLKRRLEFEDMRRLGSWMLSHLESPYYRFRFACDLALYHFHRGQFSKEADSYFQQARRLLRDNPALFGADDEGYLLTVMGDMAADARQTEFYTFIVERATLPIVGYMDGPQRIRLYGVLCQLHRFFGHHQEAIAAGRQAMTLVSQVLASDVGRTCNYLIHALVAAYREAAPRDPALLEEASTLLTASRTVWAPRHHSKALGTHLTFCQHLEAEIARLTGRPYSPGEPVWRGIWDHAWLFTLLSCARNPCHSARERQGYLDRLLKEAVKYEDEDRGGSSSLFGLFGSFYRLYAAVVRGEDASGPRRALDAWLDNQATAGFPGWRDYLAPLLPPVIDRTAVEALCDAIRYH